MALPLAQPGDGIITVHNIVNRDNNIAAGNLSNLFPSLNYPYLVCVCYTIILWGGVS